MKREQNLTHLIARLTNGGRRSSLGLAGAALIVLTPLALPAAAAEDSYMISIKDHRFEPEEIAVPAGQHLKLVIKNLDATPEEFESHELNVEKIISGGAEGIILIVPLKPGIYPFVGEFHEDTAKGRIVAK